MRYKPACRVAAGMATVVLTLSTSALADPASDSEKLVEANRAKIVSQVVERYGAAMQSHGVGADVFAAGLWSLPPDALLAASLADSADEVNGIVARSLMISPKDGIGAGANSWIGYIAGHNVASGPGSAVAAGTFNSASGANAFVAAGQSNVASGVSSLVIGGFDNQAQAIDSLIGGGAGNRAKGPRSVVVGGGYNVASGRWSFIGGGGRDGTDGSAAGSNSTDNVANGDFSVIAGGQSNRAPGLKATVGGGAANVASGDTSVVAGGGGNGPGTCAVNGSNRSCGNLATGGSATIGGGTGNQASGFDATVGGGALQTATGDQSTIGGGFANIASARYATVPGGWTNHAIAQTSFAAGQFTSADQPQCALFGLWSTLTTFTCLGSGNIFRVGGDHGFSVEYHSQRADGGGTRWVHIGDVLTNQTIGTWTGAYLSDGGTWTNASDRNLKMGFSDVDPHDVLMRVAALPIQRWHYKAEGDQITHLGPVAQDFYAAFGLGASDKAIGTVDEGGVALAAIQALKHELDDRNARIEALERELKAIKERLGL